MMSCQTRQADISASSQTIRKVGTSPFVLVVESLNQKTGVCILLPLPAFGCRFTSSMQLGVRFGTWLLERQLTPKYGYMGTNKEGKNHKHTFRCTSCSRFPPQDVVVSPNRFLTKDSTLSVRRLYQ